MSRRRGKYLLGIAVLMACLAPGAFAQTPSAKFSGEKVIWPDAMGAHFITAADLDGDGDLDPLAAIELEDKVAWYENKVAETGGFGAERVISLTPNAPVTVIAVDLDGDLDMDVVSASYGDHLTAWYENLDGKGNFGPLQVISTENLRSRGLFAADFDGDHDMDILSASDEVVWFENLDGAGSFGPLQAITTSADDRVAAWADDLDGDGDIDALAVSLSLDLVEWFENTDGAGTFGSSQALSTAADGAYHVVTADFDGDGDRDVLSGSLFDNTVEWFENLDGGANFGPGRIITTNARRVHGVYAADADGDGDIDVFSASIDDDKLAWYENLDGKGNFGGQNVLSASVVDAASVAVVDLEGDGDADILLATGHHIHGEENHGEIVWFENLTSERAFEIATVDYVAGSHSVTVAWNSRVGKSYAVEVSADLSDWEVLANHIESSNLRTEYEDTALPATGTRFYRVRRLPAVD